MSGRPGSSRRRRRQRLACASRRRFLLTGATLASAGALRPWTVHTARQGAAVSDLARAHGVPGLAFATFDDGGTTEAHVHGVKHATTRDPIDGDTVFDAASISKPVFAYVVLSLARDGRLDLDAPLPSLVPELPELAHDPRAVGLTPRLLLSHQGGLPNWRSRINLEAQRDAELFPAGDRLELVADPASGYRYSGEGYVLLQRLVEQRTGRTLASLAEERVFGPLGMTRTRFAFDDLARRNYAYGHDESGAPVKWPLGVALASSTLHSTATDLARFGSEVARQLRTEGPFAALGSQEVVVNHLADGSTHGWGLGLGVVTSGSDRYVYHGGNNVVFIADLVYGLRENLGYVLLTNSARGRRLVEPLERLMFERDIPR